jgi:HAD superfamily hydrolase (TIGR01549 family)
MEISFKILKPETKVIVFDLDGTLYCKNGMVRRMLLGAILELKLMIIERTTRKKLRGVWKGDRDAFYDMYFQQMASGHLFTAEYARWWYYNRYMPMMVRVIQKYYHLAPWVMPFINQCKQLGIRLVVLSDYGHTSEKLEALGLDISVFDWVVSAPELGGLKPANQLLDRVAARMGVLPHQCFVIGDRDDTDGQMARSANAPYYILKQ